MKRRVISIISLCIILTLLPVKEVLAENYPNEEFDLIDVDSMNTNEDIDIETSLMGSSSNYSKYFSYREIREGCGNVFTVSGFVSFVASKLGVSQASIASDIISCLGMTTFVIPDDPNHGIRVDIKKTRYYRTRAGQRHIYRITTTVRGVHKY